MLGNWKELNPEEKFKRICWTVATSSVLETGGNALEAYKKLLEKHNKTLEKYGLSNTEVSNESH